MSQPRLSCRKVAVVLIIGLVPLVGCGPTPPTTPASSTTPPRPREEVVVYTALDREFSEPIFDEFTQITGIAVRAKYDTEASKTVGLVNLILNERDSPRCDLFWNNEILNTLRLDREKLLQPYRSSWTDAYPDEYRSARAPGMGLPLEPRVLLVNRAKLPEDQWPQSIRALTEPQWRGQVGIAKPLFGTTATHAACLFAAWGPEAAKAYFREVKQNTRVYPGNRQVAQAVGVGQIAFGLTDTDDAVIEIERGSPVVVIYPDQEEGGLGTLFIPNTLSLIAGSPHVTAAQQLLNYLLSPAVEQSLAEGQSRRSR